MELLVSIMMGVGLSAACGFRIFVPLLVMGISSQAGYLTVAEELQWVTTMPAIVAFGIATVLEISGYYVPWLDNVLDTIATPAAVVAGTLAMGTVVTELDPFMKWTLALIAGGGTSAAVQGITVLTRGASTAGTGGLANPAVSTVEAGGSLFTAALAIFVPLLAVVLVVMFFVLAGRFALVQWRKRRSRQAVVPPPGEAE